MKKILSVILCLCMLLAVMPTSVSVYANTGTAGGTMEKGVLLYVGYNGYGKNMLWIPYYHAASSSSTNLGYVANKTDIFDTVIMQPSYYFQEDRESGLDIIHDSVAQQAVLDSSGAVIGGTKTSDTEIGFEIEIDERYFTDSASRECYRAYVDSFAEFVGQYPTAYYAGSPEGKLYESNIKRC